MKTKDKIEETVTLLVNDPDVVIEVGEGSPVEAQVDSLMLEPEDMGEPLMGEPTEITMPSEDVEEIDESTETEEENEVEKDEEETED